MEGWGICDIYIYRCKIVRPEQKKNTRPKTTNQTKTLSLHASSIPYEKLVWSPERGGRTKAKVCVHYIAASKQASKNDLVAPPFFFCVDIQPTATATAIATAKRSLPIHIHNFTDLVWVWVWVSERVNETVEMMIWRRWRRETQRERERVRENGIAMSVHV